MEHYEVADAFGRRHRPNLIPLAVIQKRPGGFRDTVDVDVSVRLKNVGRALARHPLLRIQNAQGPYLLWSYGVDGNYNYGLPKRVTDPHAFCGSANDVIHAGDTLEVCRFNRRFDVLNGPGGLSTTDRVFELAVEVAAEGMPCTRYTMTITEYMELMAFKGEERDALVSQQPFGW
jgi:hypothetical protein